MSDSTSNSNFFSIATYTPFVDYKILLSEVFAANPLWTDLANAYSLQDNCLIQYPIYALTNLREPAVEEDEIKAKNIRMMGLNLQKVSFLNEALASDEYDRLVRNLGIYYQTRGAGPVFVNFLSFIKNVTFQYRPLWAKTLNDRVALLTDGPGTPIWRGGTYFPTTYFDVAYNSDEFDVDDAQVTQLILTLAPVHLVLRQLVGIASSSATLYMSAIAMLISHDVSTASYVTGGGSGGTAPLDIFVLDKNELE